MSVPVTRGLSRLFIHKGTAGPTVSPTFLAWAAAGALDKPLGDVTPIKAPSQVQREAYDVIGSFRSGAENATLPVTMRYVLEKSEFLEIANRGCAFDLGIHLGKCTDPRDFNGGFKTGKVVMMEEATLTTYGTTDLGALSDDDTGEVNEEVEISALRVYEILPINFAERARSETTNEIIKVLVCDSPSCGDCDDPSDGCQKVYAVSAPAGTSPGLLPEVIVSGDGLSTVVHESPITTLAVGENPNDAACVGDYLVVISEADEGLHYALLADLQDAAGTWTRVTTGFVALSGPLAMISISPFDTYIVGENGYVYFTTDPTSGVSVLDAGVATTEDLKDVDAYSLKVVVAVGDNNSVIYTLNGGETFASVVGPAVGVNLTSVACRSEKEWWVGTASGSVYYTKDYGEHWTVKGFPSSGTGQVEDIVWASNMVGYISHTLAGRGRILRTISGGHSWYVLPEGNGSIPTADKYNSLALCRQEVNVVYAGGLADNAADGILAKGSAS